MGDISMNTYQPNSVNTQTVLMTHQESPIDHSGTTSDDFMPSGKKNKQKKIAMFMPLTKKTLITQSIHHLFSNARNRYHSQHY